MDLSQKKCVACEGGAVPLTQMEAEAMLTHVSGWALSSDSKKISKEFMDTEVKSRPTLQKYDYSFESIQDDGVRVIIFDDKPFYMVPITYKANADMQYQTGHCESNQFLTIYVMVEGKTGTAIGWNYPGCE